MALTITSKRYVNLGCGSRYHPAWTNFDLVPRGAGVIRADLSKGIPLPLESCDVVYHSAVLEHIRRAHVPGFLADCHRVLRPGGIIRVAVPDLERICSLYLQKLVQAQAGDAAAARDYDWLMLEVFDQTVRERSGGEMVSFLRQQPLLNEDFVIDRIGEEGREILARIRATRPTNSVPISMSRVIRVLGRLTSGARRTWAGLFLTSHEREALRLGRFKLSGEVHQWMYDRYSLGRILRDAGFVEPHVFTATTSRIDGWTRYALDTLPDGTVVKPDLFYMEAVKPAVV
jgi:predicted SAM-dependent methyltransferase